MDADRIQRSLRRMAFNVAETYYHSTSIHLIGINEIGCQIARILLSQVERLVPCPCHFGALQISSTSAWQSVDASLVINQAQGATILLIDDVVFTGKTLQRAVHYLLSVAEPEQLACMALIDRGHRHYPIELRFVGMHWPTKLNEYVQVLWELEDASRQVVLYYD
jgi:pyrimidine operon attenuation protein/uracil phosphoribosyltransferase